MVTKTSVDDERVDLDTSETRGRTLKRGLQARHLTMISIGGTIGTGLFLASGGSIATGGPGGALVAYIIVGVMVYFVMSSLGEMASYLPISGSFNTYAARFVDPALGFALGWNYWYGWALTVAVEISAASIVMEYWLPNFPSVVWSFVFLFLMLALNLFSVRGYAEAEYWFAMIKVITVIVFVVVGILLDVGVIGDPPEKILSSNFNHGTFNKGFAGVFAVFLVAGFSFQGTELVGIAAGESKSPEKNVPKAIRQVFWRILLFYVLAITVIGLIIPYDDPNLLTNSELVQSVKGGDERETEELKAIAVSPFTLVFRKTGFAGAAHFMNAVVLTTVLSAGNSGLYAASRVLYNLSLEGHAPKWFSYLSRQGIPLPALLTTAAVGCVAFLTLFFGNSNVYTWLLNLSSITGMIQWAGISFTHWRFRRAYLAQGRSLKELPYRDSFYPFGPIFALLLAIVIMGAQAFSIDADSNSDNEVQVSAIVSAYIGIPIFLLLFLTYKIAKRTSIIPLRECDIDSDHVAYERLEEDGTNEKDWDTSDFDRKNLSAASRVWKNVKDVVY